MKREMSFKWKGFLFAWMWIISLAMFAQNITVTGTVTNVYNEPVIGATIVVQGNATHGTVTDIDGNYTLSNVPADATLQFSYVGMATQSVPVNGRTTIEVVMDSDSEMLEEVVVTALGIKRDAKKLGYAISNVSSEDLLRTASPNLGSALYGKASGVRIQTAPGGLTGSISINVRGLSSITGTNQPLIIVDGVPIHNTDANTDGYWDNQRIQTNGLADINPEDIESLSILKGASASALYGSEAANGVVMITTKSGKGVQGFGVDFNASLTADVVAYMPKYQTTFGPGVRVGSRIASGSDADGWYNRTDRNGTMRQTFYPTTTYFGPKYDGRDVLYYDGTMRKYSPITSDPWSDVFRTGLTQQYNLAIVRGDEKGNTRLSYTYVDNLPTQYNSTYDKHNFNLTGSQKISEALSVDYAVNYILTNIKNRPYRISRLTNNFGGMFGAFDDVNYLREHTMTSLGYKNMAYNNSKHLTPDEGFEWTPSTYALVDEYYWNIYGREQLEKNNRLIASVTPTWRIIDGLTLRGRMATDLIVDKMERKEKTEQSTLFNEFTGYYGLTNSRYEIYYGDIMLTYDTNLTDAVGLLASVGWQGRTETNYESSVGTSGGLSVENWFHLNASKETKNADMVLSELLKTAFFGTVSLSYNNWAFVEATGRQEKTSTLASGNNSFFYPSVNSSIIFSELMGDSKPAWYDYGKIRASYGIVGNAPQIYKATKAYEQNSASGYIYNRIPVVIGNEGIKPEKKYEWEFGLESRFFANRLGLDMSFYTNTVKDQILETTMPSSSGARGIWMNVGELQNKGWEVSVHGTPILTKDWSWKVQGNFALNRNKVTKLAEGINTLQHRNEDNGSLFLYSKVGEPMGDFYSLAPAKDENGNNIIGSDGLYKLTDEPVKVGNAMPKFVGGFATSVAYKNISLDASFDYRVGGAILNMPYQYLMGRGSLESSMQYRDAEHGGMTYYLDANTNSVPYSGAQGPNGEKIYDNGMILPGVKEDGTPNDIMIQADKYYNWTYNWGGWDPSGPTFYSHSVFDNSYVKLRELSLTYSFASALTSKFNCKNLQLSVWGRNLFYLYKNLPDFDAEATDGTSWISQAVIGGSTATTRSFGISLRASF
ncbi:SusC/RagA family TonB-linked outer membrane protein [Proteiniphilum sp. X52]|uniref:SusC/RagA family TonB-linked outer membrane protein n=1 Tax=Proteiniphilum sp. X52 TaxID=2382159 RepID=UPI000F09D16C|nr:SusC/RagA family TonB-linked outer membrane protein [Proteiniphilum sp. X52]RNC64189.1 SusC/RagA family TonB-linked outer membrane protein [Proteiniphilum sp. X52]